MVLPVWSELFLDKLIIPEAWIRCFSGIARSKKLVVNVCWYHNITDLYLLKRDIEAMKMILLMVYLEELENIMFNNIKNVLISHLRQ